MSNMEKGKMVMFNMAGEYMLGRIESMSPDRLVVRNLSQIIPVPTPDGTVTISIRPFLPAAFGLVKDPDNLKVEVRLSAVPILFQQDQIDPELVSSFLGQTSGLAVPPSGLIMPEFSMGSLTPDPEPRKRSIDSNLPLGSDFLSLIGQKDEDIDSDE